MAQLYFYHLYSGNKILVEDRWQYWALNDDKFNLGTVVSSHDGSMIVCLSLREMFLHILLESIVIILLLGIVIWHYDLYMWFLGTMVLFLDAGSLAKLFMTPDTVNAAVASTLEHYDSDVILCNFNSAIYARTLWFIYHPLNVQEWHLCDVCCNLEFDKQPCLRNLNIYIAVVGRK